MSEHENIIIYKDRNGNNNIEVKSEHIKHILDEGELEENSVVRIFRTTANDGKSYNVKYYNLDMIVAIGSL